MKKRNFLLAILLMPLLLWAGKDPSCACKKSEKSVSGPVVPQEDGFTLKSSFQVLVP